MRSKCVYTVKCISLKLFNFEGKLLKITWHLLLFSDEFTGEIENYFIEICYDIDGGVRINKMKSCKRLFRIQQFNKNNSFSWNFKFFFIK